MDNYFDDFLKTLLDSNHTYDFFVNWDKVYKNLKNHIVEIGILNSLNKVAEEDLESKFREILINYPEVVPILPTILAIRDKKVSIFSIVDKSSILIDFSKDNFDLNQIFKFSVKTGLLDLFNNIDDLYSYLVGTEVGLDTNGRKNRSGHIFENAVGSLLQEKIKNKPDYHIGKEEFHVDVDRKKRFDYIIYKNHFPIAALECNFYNSTGSKPIEVAHAYVDLQKDTDKANLLFIWVTDGQGWKKMFSALKDVASGIDFIVNYNMLDNLLDDIID